MSTEETKPRWQNIAKISKPLGSPPSHLNSSNSALRCVAIKRIRTASSWRWRDGSRKRSSSIPRTYSGFLPTLLQALYSPTTPSPPRHISFKKEEARSSVSQEQNITVLERSGRPSETTFFLSSLPFFLES